MELSSNHPVISFSHTLLRLKTSDAWFMLFYFEMLKIDDGHLTPQQQKVDFEDAKLMSSWEKNDMFNDFIS